MNRALAALGLFALLFAAGLVWMRVNLPPPELPAVAEMVPAGSLAWFETRTPAAWLEGGGLAAYPYLAAALAGLPLEALALGLIDAGEDGRAPSGLLLAESSDPARLEAALRDWLAASGGWREETRSKLRARWSLFRRAEGTTLAFYRGGSTAALSLGAEPLERLIAGKRHGAPSLAGRPGFVPLPIAGGRARSWQDAALAAERQAAIGRLPALLSRLLAPLPPSIP